MLTVKLTREQYGKLMSIVQKKALEIVAWTASLNSVQRDDEYMLVTEILQALQEAEEEE